MGHRDEHGLGQCKHMMLPSGSSKCAVTHTLKRPVGSFLWSWFAATLARVPSPTHDVSWAPLAALWHNCKLSGMLTVWNPMQGLGVFCRASLCPKQLCFSRRIHSCQATWATETGLSRLERIHLGITLGSPTVMLYSSITAVEQPTANFPTGLVSKCYTSCPHW